MSEHIYEDSDMELDCIAWRVTVPFGSMREEIVRCRDCTRYSEQEPGGEIGLCNLGLEDLGLLSVVEPDGFCAWGKRVSE